MIYRRFGRSELEIPIFSCGGMRYQQSWNASDPVTSSNQRNLEATIDRAIELGIRHIETARGYGTSEAQLGRALSRYPRDELIVQSKVAPCEDPGEFERHLEETFERLRVDRLDLFAFHGLNHAGFVDWTLREGGCLEVAERFRATGRIGHIGFSTHGPCELIVDAIESDRFDYVNLHWYYIFQDNGPALDAAKARDMGVFIISPSDKGGRLYDPPDKLVRLCAPFSPMVFNDLFCLRDPRVHTISLGAAKPSDFDEHLEVPPALERERSSHDAAVDRLVAEYASALGADFAAGWRAGLPAWDEAPGGVNVRAIVWLRNLAAAFDLHEYGRMRYALLGKDDHWFAGNRADAASVDALRESLSGSPFRERIIEALLDAHEWFQPDEDEA